MLLYILLGFVAFVIVIVIAASLKPNTVHYGRSAVIKAPPEEILPHIIDFRKWQPWSPWELKDPDMKREYGGASSGVGAKYHWLGNNKVGEGSMEVLSADSSGVRIHMRFIKPWKAECRSEFQFTRHADGTHVLWTMDGPNLFMGKVFSLVMNMDKAIGRDFETGLAGLKARSEKV